MSKFAPILPRLEIECWILGVEMSSYWVRLIAMGLCSVTTVFQGLIKSFTGWILSFGYWVLK